MTKKISLFSFQRKKRHENMTKWQTRQALYLLGLTGILYLFSCKSQVICDTLRNINSFWQNRLAVFYCTPLLTTVYDFQALRTDQSKIIFSVPSGFKNTVFEIPLHSSVTFCSREEQRRTLCILPSLHSKSTVMSPCAFIPRLFRLSTHPEVPEATGNALSCSG